MKRAKAIRSFLRLANSSRFTQSSSTTRSLLHSQVTHYSNLSPCLFAPSLLQKQVSSTYHDLLNTNHKSYFSSTPNSLVELVMTNEWSEELEQELERSNPTLTYETIIYILKKLGKTPEKAFAFYKWVSEKNGFKPSSTVYNLMLRILGRKESMKDFWVVVKRMGDEGYDVDQGTYLTLLGTFRQLKLTNDAAALTGLMNLYRTQESSISATVKGVTEVILESDWDNLTKNKLRKLKLSLSENLVVKIFWELRRHPLKALQFFRWVKEDLGYEHTAVTYNAVVRVLGQEDSIAEFWDVVKEMKSAGLNVDIDTYIKVSRNFQKNRMNKDTVELYEFMMDGACKPSVQECSTLLKHLSMSSAPDLSLVFRVVKKFEATGHSLSKAVYDGIHRSLTSVGKFDEAENIIKTMRNVGYEPDNITYSQLVFGLCKAGRLEEACNMLDEMESHGCAPDLKTWTILIQGHCTAGEVDEALKCFTRMLEKNLSADADLLCVLVNGLYSKDRVNSAYNLVVEMVDKAKLRPWQATYKEMIQKLLGEEKLEEALNLLRLMRKQNFPPFGEPFLQYISKFGTVDDASEYLKSLSFKNLPTVDAYVHVFESFLKEGRQPEALDLFFKCPHHIRNHHHVLDLFSSPKRGNPISSKEVTASSFRTWGAHAHKAQEEVMRTDLDR